MLYTFTIISDEVENFIRQIKIDATSTFLDLHQAIIDSCGYKDDQMVSFTICENGWEKGQEITLEVMDTDSYEDSVIMAETELTEYLEDEKQHLLYTFDPLADRVFFIELSKIETGKHLSAPEVVRSSGNAPQQQMDFDQMFAENPISDSASDLLLSDDDDESLFGSEISTDEIDLEGYDISEE